MSEAPKLEREATATPPAKSLIAHVKTSWAAAACFAVGVGFAIVTAVQHFAGAADFWPMTIARTAPLVAVLALAMISVARANPELPSRRYVYVWLGLAGGLFGTFFIWFFVGLIGLAALALLLDLG